MKKKRTLRSSKKRSFVYCAYWALAVPMLQAHASTQSKPIVIVGKDIRFSLYLKNSRYGFSFSGHETVGFDRYAGILLAGEPVNIEQAKPCSISPCTFRGTNASGDKLRLTVVLSANHAEMIAEPEVVGKEIRFITKGAQPAYGLADHAVEQSSFTTKAKALFDTEVSEFKDDAFRSGQGTSRLVSNFVIYPKQQFAEILVEPTLKIVHTSSSQIVQGVVRSPAAVHLHYFFGDPHEIYREYLKVRNGSGFPVLMPKYEAFGVGWEAWGALGWNTNQKTVQESIDRYLAEGYPLKWAVIGSGFWAAPPAMRETTSFGFWNEQKYPDPKAMIQHLQAEGVKVLLGLRITFVETGPYSAEGRDKGYFLKKDGKAEVFKSGWPDQPYHVLDAQNPDALNWYLALVQRWLDSGIDGFKEDFYSYQKYTLRDDKVDPVNNRLMRQGKMIIERNGYLSSNGDLHRIDDFNFNQNQDRGPVNALAFAYSGFPFIYPDIVGGTFSQGLFSTTPTPKMEMYMMRNAQWAALHSSMGMGEPPWHFKKSVSDVVLNAAQLHNRIAPYLYSNARRAVTEGYPWTMAPLPLAFPGDTRAYGRENARDRGYEWMIGDAMLATPLYGNDYETAKTQDVYLPEGQWMDFDTGRLYAGHQILKSFALPPGKTPIFIGGSGVTVEKFDGSVRACVYPVADHAAVELTLPEDSNSFSVHVLGLAVGMKWSNVQVTDETGQRIDVERKGFAFTFVPHPGKTYTVHAIQ